MIVFFKPFPNTKMDNYSNITAEKVGFIDNGSPSTGFITLASAMVFLMTPGLGLFYSGLSRYNNALSLIMLCMLSMAVVTIQFFLFGFSLAFSETGGPFIGDFADVALASLGAHAMPHSAPQIPSIAFMLYQMQFATISAALIFGSVPERTRFVPAMIFVLLWTTFVYDFVAYWAWGDHGWIRNLSCLEGLSDPTSVPCFVGGLDFAGGGPVHIASGYAGLAYCLMIGKRKRMHQEHHSVVNIFFGTCLLWFGWFGFNGGSVGASNTRAAMAAVVTTLSAASGGISWVGFDFIFTRKLSALSFCSGIVAGLVVITPGAGFVAPWAAIIFGVAGGVLCNIWCRLKKHFGFDDSFDAWSIHGSGGFLGSLLTGVFAQKWVALLDNTKIDGGWIEGNWILMVYQFVGSLVIACWSLVVSFVILFVINKIPGLHLRQTEEDERLGGDFVEMGEVGYMLIISEPGAEHASSNTLGMLKDGRRVSTVSGIISLSKTEESKNSMSQASEIARIHTDISMVSMNDRTKWQPSVNSTANGFTGNRNHDETF